MAESAAPLTARSVRISVRRVNDVRRVDLHTPQIESPVQTRYPYEHARMDFPDRLRYLSLPADTILGPEVRFSGFFMTAMGGEEIQWVQTALEWPMRPVKDIKQDGWFLSITLGRGTPRCDRRAVRWRGP